MKGKNSFTLIELVLVISIVALLIMAVGLTSGIRENAKVHSAAESIKSLRAAAESYIASGSMTYTGITIDGLKTAGFLPNRFTAAGSNPWGGDYAIAANSDANKVDISLSAVNAAAAGRLSALFTNSAAATAYLSDTWTATF
ncbi:MAG: type II secretion system protein [Candidatus Omnitrophica bacterium]|jgi:type II secretory pathway pseudopilin PulG|nr:type II secretion system protein [Candidatus Omnitrophota bacterium]